MQVRFAALAALMLAGCVSVGPARRFDVEPTQLQARSAPILLVHGMLAGPRPLSGLTTFDGAIVRALAAAGFDVWCPALTAVGPSSVRAPELARAIELVLARSGAAKVHVIAHSQAGIDARLVLEDPRVRERIASVTTLSSPHGGTPLANVGVGLRGSLAERVIARFGRRIAEARGWPGDEGDARGLIGSLTTQNMAHFAVEHPLQGEVPFYTLAATPLPAGDGSCDGGAWPAPTRPNAWHPFMALGAAIMREQPGEADAASDGMVPTRAQRFGRFLGCLPIDHIGWMRGRSRRGGVDVLAFYVELARALAELEHGTAAAFDSHLPALSTIVGAPAR